MWFSRNFDYLLLQKIHIFTVSPLPYNMDLKACLSVDCYFDLNGSQKCLYCLYSWSAASLYSSHRMKSPFGYETRLEMQY